MDRKPVPLPESLKSGIEALSGESMDAVKISRNSPTPAAFAIGNQIQLASEEKHLPHEAWHVVERVSGKISAHLKERTTMPPQDVILKRFDSPDETRTFPLGKFELIHIGGMTIGRATYEPGWKWSTHVGAALGQTLCQVEHVGQVISGAATAAMTDGRVIELHPGDFFYIGPGHDSWVLGNEPYVSLHFQGAQTYATK